MSTRKKWRPIIAAVAKEIPDIRIPTDLWCVSWKDKLLGRGLSNRWIKFGHLAALRSTCAWAVTNKRISVNPVDGLSVKVAKPKRGRPKGYTDDEASLILGLTREPINERLSKRHQAARRWMPWLCCYTGAPVGEMAQLRGKDVQLHEGVWLMWVTPEAGSTKDGNARFFAVHPHLIEQGFLDFVKGGGAGPLFYSDSRRRGGSKANPIYKKVGERIVGWIRERGLTDATLQPNHAWRHRFKTLARRHEMDRAPETTCRAKCRITRPSSMGISNRRCF